MPIHKAFYFFATVAVMAVSGCTTLEMPKSMTPELPSWMETTQTPDKVVCFWGDPYLRQNPDGEVIRGFAGRLMFYKAGSKKAVKIDGEARIYAYDETNRDPSNPVPDKRSLISAETLANQHVKTELGHAYDIAFDWGPADGPQKSVSLIVKFKPNNGGSWIFSEMSQQTLLGTPTVDPDAPTTLAEEMGVGYDDAVRPRNPIRPASFNQFVEVSPSIEEGPSEATSQDSLRMRTMTIHRPSRFGGRSVRTTTY